MFYANPQPAEKMRLNQFLKVEAPLNRVLLDLEDRIERFSQVISANEELFEQTQDEGEEIQIISDSITSLSETNPIERALSALLAFHNRHEQTEQPVEEVEELEVGRLNIFSKVPLDASVKALIGAKKIDQFSEPLINRNVAKDKIELLERLMGRSASQANPMTSEIIKDMTIATDYPPEVEGLLLPSEEIIAIANELSDYVTSLKSKAQEEGA
jgi:intracellular multiplication protein IcmO